jgi:hypothetical protein
MSGAHVEFGMVQKYGIKLPHTVVHKIRQAALCQATLSKFNTGMKLPHILLATLAAAACRGFGATVANVQADVTNLTGNITAFSGALSAYDPNSFPISAIVRTHSCSTVVPY